LRIWVGSVMTAMTAMRDPQRAQGVGSAGSVDGLAAQRSRHGGH
jgi:hypothetical protein